MRDEERVVGYKYTIGGCGYRVFRWCETDLECDECEKFIIDTMSAYAEIIESVEKFFDSEKDDLEDARKELDAALSDKLDRECVQLEIDSHRI